MQSLITRCRTQQLLNVIAGIAINFMMFLTVTDVILRPFATDRWHYELSPSRAIRNGFAVPLTTFLKRPCDRRFFVLQVSERDTEPSSTWSHRVMGTGFFPCSDGNDQAGMDLYEPGEVSLTLQLPFYPVASELASVAFVQCLVPSRTSSVIGGPMSEVTIGLLGLGIVLICSLTGI